jgi:hypothetical protein
MFKVLEDLPDGVVGISATGTIGGDDYETTLEPAINEAVEQHGKIALLMVLGPDFEGYSAGAALDDMRFGFSNFRSFRRIAIVSDNQWLRNGAAAMLYLMPGKSKGFSVGELDAAKEWIADKD